MSEKYSRSEKAEILDLLFFLMQMPRVQISIHNSNEFIVNYSNTHSHITFNTSGEDTIITIKNIIVRLHNENKEKVFVSTHEKIKSQGISSHDFIMENRGMEITMIISEESLNDYLLSINSFEEDLNNYYKKEEEV